MKKRQLDWTATADRAKGMTSAELHYARLDCVKAAEAADAFERGGVAVEKDGGYYRDESSVYAAEQRRRVA